LGEILRARFYLPMGATPPNPLATVGKAHFRSAAFGGAPHFVRRKNAANAAFLYRQVLIGFLGDSMEQAEKSCPCSLGAI